MKTIVVCRFEFVRGVKMRRDRQAVKCKEEEQPKKEREGVERVRRTARGRETPRRRERAHHERVRERGRW